MKWSITLVGVAIVMVILRDVFHTPWHPTRHGGLSRAVMTGPRRLSTRLPPRWRAAGLAGPLGMVEKTEGSPPRQRAGSLSPRVPGKHGAAAGRSGLLQVRVQPTGCVHPVMRAVCRCGSPQPE